ncbi:MAG: aspartate carbamoyltransferase catalytic subunit [Peptococcaceae bacterium]|nr:aspartate carbamoyltransferase catalytic subunit [Peptococcaceae bacterium]
MDLKPKPWQHKDLLGIEQLSAHDIAQIFQAAVSMKEILERPIKKLPTLRGKSVGMLFYEASTRTRVSFETAAKTLGADVGAFAVNTSSVSKGESLLDTAKTLDAMKFDLIVIRHASSGAAAFLADNLSAGVINAGDGQHEHPTQALLDAFTLCERFGPGAPSETVPGTGTKTDYTKTVPDKLLAGRKIVIVGDILHSRVARSNALCLRRLGADVTFVGPPTLLPPEMACWDVTISHDLDAVLQGADAVMALRLQLERQKSGLFPSVQEYAKLYGLTVGRLKQTCRETLLLHPGPMNRGVEIDSELADSFSSVVEEQVTNGVAVRMALIYLLIGGGFNS